MANMHIKCSYCLDSYTGSEDHTPMTIQYNCPECNHFWSDDWCAAVDGVCPICNEGDIEPLVYDEMMQMPVLLDSLPVNMKSYRGIPKLSEVPMSSYTYSFPDKAEVEKRGSESSGPKKEYWTQPIPNNNKLDRQTSEPTEAKRAKLRAKRKKRK